MDMMRTSGIRIASPGVPRCSRRRPRATRRRRQTATACRTADHRGRHGPHGAADRGTDTARHTRSSMRATRKPPARFEVKAPAKRAERRDRVDRRRRLRRAQHVRRADPHADDGQARAGRPEVQQLPHHGAVLADAQCAQDRPQPSHCEHRLDHGERDRVPGNTGQNPNSVAPLAEMLRLNGYSTGAFGKWHETAAWETSVSGPFDRWPTHQGFDKFYGFIGGETDQGTR